MREVCAHAHVVYLSLLPGAPISDSLVRDPQVMRIGCIYGMRRGRGASEAKGPYDGFGVSCLSPDQPSLCHSHWVLASSAKSGRTPTGRCKKPAEMAQGFGPALGPDPPGAATQDPPCALLSRREDKLRIQNGWLCHLAPEIIRQLSPDTEEDKLPFSKHSDVFALG